MMNIIFSNILHHFSIITFLLFKNNHFQSRFIFYDTELDLIIFPIKLIRFLTEIYAESPAIISAAPV
jgi:hypothetical protein